MLRLFELGEGAGRCTWDSLASHWAPGDERNRAGREWLEMSRAHRTQRRAPKGSSQGLLAS
jgi:hypothetical protein